MSGGGGSTTTTEIPREYRPLATEYAARASQLSNEQFTPYSGQRVAGLSDAQNQAGGFYQNAMGAGTNPYLDQMVGRAQSGLVDQYNNVIRPQQDAMMARSGSFGNSGVQQTVGQDQNQLIRGLNDISTQMYGGQYNNDQAYRMNAANQLGQFGQQQQNTQQNQLDFNYQQFQDQMNQPYRNLQTLGSPLSMNLGSVTRQSGGK